MHDDEYIENEFIGSEYVELTETEEKILSVLAWKGAKTYYEIFKKENLCSSSTAWKLIKKLEKSGLIEVKETKPFRIRGRKKKLYGLTFRGLIAALIPGKESWKHIDAIAKQQDRLLPLIFGKWNVFKEYVDYEKFNKILRFTFVFAHAAVLLDFEERILHERILSDLFAQILSVMIEHEERISWLKAIRSDPELRQRFLQEERIYRAYSELWGLSFNLIQKTTPNWDKALEELQKLAPLRGSLTV